MFVRLAYSKLGWEKGTELHDVLINSYYAKKADLNDRSFLISEGEKVGLEIKGIFCIFILRFGKG
jgi:hypothetical protein